MRRLSYEANGSHSGFSDIRVYSVTEELIACYNHALSAASGCSLLLRINELEYQMARWWFQIFFIFTPLGKIPILTNIFQMG